MEHFRHLSKEYPTLRGTATKFPAKQCGTEREDANRLYDQRKLPDLFACFGLLLGFTIYIIKHGISMDFYSYLNGIYPTLMVLDGFGWFWMVLDGFGWFWMVLDGFGWFWLLLGGLEIPHIVFFAEKSRGRVGIWLRKPAPNGWLKPQQNNGMFTSYQLVADFHQ